MSKHNIYTIIGIANIAIGFGHLFYCIGSVVKLNYSIKMLMVNFNNLFFIFNFFTTTRQIFKF
jgi:hypothetical protein